jgi:S-adenosylmethionine hydrolase
MTLHLLAFVAGCAPEPTGPVLTRVEPEWGWTGEATEVDLVGERFFPEVVVGGQGGGQVDAGFSAFLDVDGDEVPLERVVAVDYETVHAEVPEGVEAGAWDVVLASPTGARARLTEGFVVTDTRADALAVEVSSAAYEVGDYATLVVSVVDPGGAVVPQTLPVRVEATSGTDAEGVVFARGLEDQVDLETGVGIEGSLDVDGTATLLVKSTVPDDVTFVVTAPETPTVDATQVLLSWDPGDLATVELSLPRDEFVTRAGEAFDLDITLLDAQGNVLPDEVARLFLLEDAGCGDLREQVEVVGQATVSVTLETSCEVDHLQATNESVDVTSAAFSVIPAEMSAFRVTTNQSTVAAGTEVLGLTVEAVDAFGNVVTDATETFSLSDESGGIDTSRTLCSALAAGEASCTTYLLVAGEDALVVTGTDGHTGRADVTVTAGEPATVDVVPGASRVAAGEVFGVGVTVTDAWGNAVDISPGADDPVQFLDDTGTIDCSWSGPLDEGETFDCAITAASMGLAIQAIVASRGVEGVAGDLLDVVNAELALVELDAPGTSPSAGDAFTLVARAYDAWDNAYQVQTDPVLDLRDSTGSLSPSSLALDGGGEARVSASITVAGDTTVIASQAGVDLGSSEAFEVRPAAMAAFELTLPTWIDVDEGAEVTVTAVDAYGNTQTSYGGSATVTSRAGLCENLVLPAFSDGVSGGALTCTTVGLGDRFDATDTDGFTGASDTLDVVDLACADGPVARLTLDGDDDVVTCLSSAEVTVDADAGGSTSGSAGLVLYHFDDSDGGRTRTLTTALTYTFGTPGARRISLLAVQSDGCAAEDEGVIWVGEDDGEPTGPVSVTVADSAVESLTGATTVTLSAQDCAGDVAAGQAVYVRADLGELAGTATGAGLTVTLDASGEATVDWTFPEGSAGTAGIYTGSETGGAFGGGSLAVEEDAAPPHVVEVMPSGATSGVVDEIVVTFDEDILDGSPDGAVTLEGPDGEVPCTATLDGGTLTLAPSTTVDADAGTWTLTLGAIRDEAGNKLDGEWTGGPSAFEVQFGAVADSLPSVSECPGSTDTFRPDGDPGTGEEADEVVLSPTSSASPTWWWLVVEDEEGTRVRSLRVAGGSAAVTWDGRSDGGIIQAPADYVLVLRAVDGSGNVGAPCSGAVRIAQRVVSP